jgi:hypothetical protein
VGQASSRHGKAGSARQTGRHRRRQTRANRAVKIVGVAAPAVALAGLLVALQGHPASPPNPVASSVAAYYLHPDLVGAGSADVYRDVRATAGHSGKAGGKPSPASGGSSKASPAARAGKAVASKADSGTSPAPAPASSSPAATTALTCSGTPGTGMLPQNYVTIVDFLVAHGYTDVAAAGIAGNIYQESGGNPESVGTGGGGLIGWTPLPAGFVTGDVAADLQTQLQALLTFNQQWAQYIPELNAAANAVDAADIYMNYFERPGYPAASNREDAAAAVAQACGIPA